MPEARWIADQYAQLVKERGREIALLREATDLYNWDIVLALPGKDKNERAALANLVKKATDQYARRTTSVLPSILVPPTREGKKNSEDRAKKEQDVLYGWWYKNEYKAKSRRRARWLYCYGSAPIWVRPPTSVEARRMGAWVPIFEERSPLGFFYPAPSSQSDITPEYGIMAGKKTWKWLTTHHPTAAAILKPDRPNPHDEYEILTYVDAEELHLVVLGNQGYSEDFGWVPGAKGQREAVTLEVTHNHAGICTAVVPGRITLDRSMGAVDASVYGMFLEAGKLRALQYMGIFEQVIPEEWVESRDPGVKPRVVQEANPTEGVRGIIQGGTLNRLGMDPTMLVANNPIDHIERDLRHNLELPAQMGGENPTNVRTGAASDLLIGATMDFGIQEDQETLAQSAREELKRAIRVAKTRGATPQKFFVGWPGVKDHITYTADDLYTEDIHVAYSLPGLDADRASVRLGNAMALRMMSESSARRLHPDIEDPEFERRQIEYETLQAGLRQEVLTPGAIPVRVRARVLKLVRENGLTLEDAILKAEREEQERQAQSVSAVPGSPESQPGIGPTDQPLVAPQVAGPLDELALLFQDQRGIGRGT